jgi:hypothetical protein
LLNFTPPILHMKPSKVNGLICSFIKSTNISQTSQRCWEHQFWMWPLRNNQGAAGLQGMGILTLWSQTSNFKVPGLRFLCKIQVNPEPPSGSCQEV